MNVQEIIRLLEDPAENYIPCKKRISSEAADDDLIAAMHEAIAPRTRQILCDILGERQIIQAQPVLLIALEDSSPAIRSAAADALAKVGDEQAGPVLLKRYQFEEDRDVRVMLAVALGAVHYRPAIPDLLQSLNDPYETLQVEAAWSLGELKATEAREEIERVLARQVDDYSKKLVQDAIEKLK